LSTIGNISFGEAFVAGKNLVPSPAAGNIAFLIFFSITGCILYHIVLAVKGFIKKGNHIPLNSQNF
jgi:hypothetical protein